jgi:hypothetical protein
MTKSSSVPDEEDSMLGAMSVNQGSVIYLTETDLILKVKHCSKLDYKVTGALKKRLIIIHGFTTGYIIRQYSEKNYSGNSLKENTACDNERWDIIHFSW